MSSAVFGRWSSWVALACLAIGGASCSSTESNTDAVEWREGSGTLKLPLTTTSESGATYYLTNATFLVRDADGEPVVTLSSEDEAPDAQTISVDLDVGNYTVELLPGWALRRLVDGEPRLVAATLSSPTVVEVSITEQTTSTVLFEFLVGPNGTTGPEGSLDVGIAVMEGASCGNGLVDESEACDDGYANGSADHCDWTCAFVCQGACPLRVDPGAAESGDGSSWASALVSVSAAIEQQFALGGGEVWVRGPGPYARLAGDPDVTLIALRDGVRLIGGFSGTESRIGERNPTAQTIISGVPEYYEASAPLIVGAPASQLEGFSISTHSGTVLAFPRADRGFRVVNFTISNSYHYSANLIEVTDTNGSFDGLRIEDSTGITGVSGVHVERSRVSISNSDFARLRSYDSVTGIVAIDDSKLLLDNVWFVDNFAGDAADNAGVVLTNSDALAVDSVWLRNRGFGPSIDANDSRFVAVSSHWEENRVETPLALFGPGSAASFVNCSFVANLSLWAGVVVARDSLQVVNSTFLNNGVSTTPPGQDPRDIAIEAGGSLTLYNSFSNRGENSVVDPYTGTGNCFVDENAAVDVRTEPGYSEVYLTPELGCSDIGDNNAAENAMQDAAVFAMNLGGSIPYDETWWQSMTSVLSLCPDAPPIDAGRHYVAPSCDEP